jgi:hypothetical protein
MATLNRWAERELLAGPDDEADPNLLVADYNPQVWRDMLEKRAEQERYLVGQLDIEPKYRQGPRTPEELAECLDNLPAS